MKSTVLGEIYNSLTTDELKKLNKFISKSHWEYRETILKCHELFYQYTKEDNLDLLDKNILFNYIYQNEEYNDTKLRFVMNRMLDALREFVILQKEEKGSIFTEKIWVDFLMNKKLSKSIKYNLNKEKEASSSEYKYLYEYFKSQQKVAEAFLLQKNIDERFKLMTDTMHKADIFSDLVFLRNYCSLITFSNVYQSTPFDLPQSRLELVKEKYKNVDLPEFEVYLSLINLLNNDQDEESYKGYKNILFKYLDIWNEEEKVNFIAYLLNFTTRKINSGQSQYIDEQYELYTQFEKMGIFNLSSYVNTGRINNVIHIYLRKKDYERARYFLDNYLNSLPDNQRESCYHFNLARIEFEEKNYKNSLRELLQVDFSNIAFYSLNSKLLLLKIYYEIEETDAFLSLCSSFNEYIRNNKIISDFNKTQLKNFIKMTKKLYRANPNKKAKLKKDVEDATKIAEKNWLLEKTSV